MSIELKGWETERGKNIWLFMATFTNNTNTELSDIKVNFPIGSKFTLSKENTEIPVEEDGENLKFTIDNIGAGETVKEYF